MINRVIVVVMDSVGVGELPDAYKYGDEGSNTLLNVSLVSGGLNAPNFYRLGLGNIIKLEGIPPNDNHLASFGKMVELSAGKDTTTGHWEMMGIITNDPFPTFPSGFPSELINEFEKRIGRQILGNKVASGTEIIEEYGPLHIKTGCPIVYTSADSVFQIASHEEVIPIEQLYGFCVTARRMLTGQYAVGRVIARPFVGKPGGFKRTDRRKDFSLMPPGPTVLDFARDAGKQVIAIGKIKDVFSGQGITEAIHTKNNMDGVNQTIRYILKDFSGIIFTNLVDFDTLYGHRNNPRGYAEAFEMLDERLNDVLNNVKTTDLLILTADHGCDPTTESTDHSREYVPLIVYNPVLKPVNLGVRKSFADIGATISDFLSLEKPHVGESFRNLLSL
jgi:phosphopentomutase